MDVKRRGLFIVIVAIALHGCAGPATYRYANKILVPPGVKSAAVTQRSATIPVTASCSSLEGGVELRRHGHDVRVTVNTASLAAHPAGWLSTWTTSLEKNGCLRVGEGRALAVRITEMVPLDPKIAFSLLHPSVPISGYVDLGPEHRLKVVGPIMRDGSSSGALDGGSSTSAEGNRLTATMRASKDLLGYETAWFAIRPASGHAGSEIVALTAEDNIEGKVSRPDKPRFDYFQFPAGSGFYRLFYLTRISRSDHDLALMAASTQAALEDQTQRFIDDPRSCIAPGCILIPRESAVVPHVMVTARGAEVAVPSGGSINEALKAAGVAQPASVLPTLRVQRRFAGKLTPVVFDRGAKDILDLPLMGGEDLAW